MQAPLTIVILGIAARVKYIDIVYNAVASALAVGALYAAAMSPGCPGYWAIFAFAIAIGAVIAFNLVFTFLPAAQAQLPAPATGTVRFVVYATILLWAGYASLWGSAEGGDAADATQEVIAYALMDVITKAVLPLILLLNFRSVLAYGNALAWLGGGADIHIGLTATKTV